MDPLSNNNKTGVPTTTEIEDDIIVDSNGNIGLGTTTSKAKIDIKTSGTKAKPVTGFILEDGNQSTLKILTSDANGNATWKYAKPIGAVLGTFSSTGVVVSIDAGLTGTVAGLPLVARPGNTFIKTGASIALAPGRWWVKVALYLSAAQSGNVSEQAWVRTTLMDDASFGGKTPGTQFSADLESSYTLASNNIWKNPGGMIIGSFLLNNKSTGNKTYYLGVGWIDNNLGPNTETKTVYRTGMSSSAENVLIAYRISE